MGNCLVLEEKVIRPMVMKSDAKILEYKHPIKVHQVLSEFSHYSLPDEPPIVKHVNPKRTTKKAVRLEDGGPPSGVVRIKVVMSKKELRRMVCEGEVRVNDMIISKVQNYRSTNKYGVISKGWSPVLDCIPEIH